MELFWKMKTPVMSEFKQQGHCKGFVSLGRWRPQRECQKSSKFILAKEQLCTCSILLGTFFSFSTTTWNCLVSRFIEEVIMTLSKDDGDSNKNGKKGIGLIRKTTTLHMHHITLCVLFTAVTAQLWSESAQFHVLWRTGTKDNDFLFLFLYFDTVL